MSETKLGCEMWSQAAKNSQHAKNSQAAKFGCINFYFIYYYYYYLFSKTNFF